MKLYTESWIRTANISFSRTLILELEYIDRKSPVLTHCTMSRRNVCTKLGEFFTSTEVSSSIALCNNLQGGSGTTRLRNVLKMAGQRRIQCPSQKSNINIYSQNVALGKEQCLNVISRKANGKRQLGKP
jgi:hypothetical protein